ncbi:pirin family protein [Algihabitans sp.]|uniref:pirin family protein n=1 Tax=Algihabitans sp. TaxID=2821514 RepID=UPI003BA88FC5
MTDDWREIEIPGRERDLGDGFMVRRVLPFAKRRLVGPFVFFDEMGPANFAPGQGLDVRPHPHIGLATVTYLFEGEILHRDSLGSVQTIQPGAVNWMTAGRGIAHSERTPDDARRNGQRLHGIQTWIALPRAQEKHEPAFIHHPADRLPQASQDGVVLRVIAGEAFGLVSPVAVFSPTLYVAIEMAAGATLEVPPEYKERGVYPVSGELEINDTPCPVGHLQVLTPGSRVTLRAAGATQALLLGGDSLEGQRHIWWNFVASEPEMIEQAKADWRNQHFDPVPGETEFIPLPE